MNLTKDGIGLRGILRVCVRDARTGRAVRRHEIRNKITFLAADTLVELWAQRAADPNPIYDQVWSLRVGSSNTAASRGDTNLGAYVIAIGLNDAGKVTSVPGELTFIGTLGNGDANGNTLREAGLFTRGSAGSPQPPQGIVQTGADAPGTSPGTPRMVARQVFPDIPKTSAITVEFQWSIAFTA